MPRWSFRLLAVVVLLAVYFFHEQLVDFAIDRADGVRVWSSRLTAAAR